MWTAFLGLHDQSKRSAPGVQERRLQRVISHPFFNDFTFDYDIALLQLEQPVEYTALPCSPSACRTPRMPSPLARPSGSPAGATRRREVSRGGGEVGVRG